MTDAVMVISIQIAVCVALSVICISMLVFTGQTLWLVPFIWNYIGSLYFLSMIDKAWSKR